MLTDNIFIYFRDNTRRFSLFFVTKLVFSAVFFYICINNVGNIKIQNKDYYVKMDIF